MTQAMEVLLFKEALNKFTMSHVAVKFEMIARRIAQVVVILRCQAMQQSKRSNLTVTLRALALRAVCSVRLLAKGMAISFVTFLASHPVKPSAWPCGTCSGLP